MDDDSIDLDHLFGVKKPFRSPLYLSIPLTSPRRLTPDEARQICARDSAIKPSTREDWELSPKQIDGEFRAVLSKINFRVERHIEASWTLPVVKSIGLLRLSSPLGSGRALTREECRQLRSFSSAYRGVHPSWSIVPSNAGGDLVTILRYPNNKVILVGELHAECPQRTLVPRPRRQRTFATLELGDRGRISSMF